MHHIRADIDHLYLPRGKCGRCIIQLELTYKTSKIGQMNYLEATEDWMLRTKNTNRISSIQYQRKVKNFKENLIWKMNSDKLEYKRPKKKQNELKRRRNL